MDTFQNYCNIQQKSLFMLPGYVVGCVKRLISNPIRNTDKVCGACVFAALLTVSFAVLFAGACCAVYPEIGATAVDAGIVGAAVVVFNAFIASGVDDDASALNFGAIVVL